MYKLTTVLVAAACVSCSAPEPGEIDNPDPSPSPQLAQWLPADTTPALLTPASRPLQRVASGAGPSRIRLRVSPVLMQLLGEPLETHYERRTGGVDIVELRASDEGALSELAQGRAEVAFVYKKPDAGQRAHGLTVSELGHRLVYVIVNSQNPVTTLPRTALGQLLRGVSTNWRCVSYFDRPVRRFGGPRGPVLDDATQVLGLGERWPGTTVATEAGVIARVAQDAGALGVVSRKPNNPRVRVVPVDGAEPSVMLFRAGYYRLGRTVYLVSRVSAGAATRDLVDWLGSDDGQEFVSARLSAD